MVDPDRRLGDGGSVAAGQARARPRVVVVGAGIAGLMCARELAATGVDVVVVDKGRGVGGRMATRRFGGAVFDHGASTSLHDHRGSPPRCRVGNHRGWSVRGSIAADRHGGGCRR